MFGLPANFARSGVLFRWKSRGGPSTPSTDGLPSYFKRGTVSCLSGCHPRDAESAPSDAPSIAIVVVDKGVSCREIGDLQVGCVPFDALGCPQGDIAEKDGLG